MLGLGIIKQVTFGDDTGIHQISFGPILIDRQLLHANAHPGHLPRVRDRTDLRIALCQDAILPDIVDIREIDHRFALRRDGEGGNCDISLPYVQHTCQSIEGKIRDFNINTQFGAISNTTVR